MARPLKHPVQLPLLEGIAAKVVRTGPRRNKHPELDLQKAIVEYARWLMLPPHILHASNAEVRAGGEEAQREQAERTELGAYTGHSDLTLYCEDGVTVVIELKTKTGRLSPDQIAFRDRMVGMGHRHEVVRSIEQFRAVAELYGARFRRAWGSIG